MLYTVYYKNNTYYFHGEENDRTVYHKIRDTINKTELALHKVKVNEYETYIYVTSEFGSDCRKWYANEELARNYVNCGQYMLRKLHRQAEYSWEELKAMREELIKIENELFYHNMADRWTEEERKEVNSLEYRRRVLREVL